MSSCCNSEPTESAKGIPKRHTCPSNGKDYLQVPHSTVLLHIQKPWGLQQNELKEQGYYFCSDPACDVVYFGEDNSLINTSALRTVVGVKQPKDDNALSCYCFDVTHKEARDNTSIRQYVIDKTKNGACSCESQNPSGRCCLKDFPRAK